MNHPKENAMSATKTLINALITQRDAANNKLRTHFVTLCTKWCAKLDDKPTVRTLAECATDHEAFFVNDTEELILEFQHYIGASKANEGYSERHFEQELSEEEIWSKKNILCTFIPRHFLGGLIPELEDIYIDKELSCEYEQPSKDIGVKLTLNGTEYQFDSALDALHDSVFSSITKSCGYSDTGGGWRDTYRRLLKPLVREFIRNPAKHEQTSEQPKFSIEPS